MLKNSERNSRLARSVSGIVLPAPRSICQVPGPRSRSRGAVPNSPSRGSKRRGIDPLRDASSSRRSQRNARNQIGALRAGGPIGRGITAGHQHIHREAGACQGGGRQFPVAQDRACNPAIIQPRLPSAERQLIDRIAIDHMGRVPGAAGAITGQAQRILWRYFVAIAAAVRAVVDLVGIHVIGRQQQSVGERTAQCHARDRCKSSCRRSPATE